MFGKSKDQLQREKEERIKEQKKRCNFAQTYVLGTCSCSLAQRQLGNVSLSCYGSDAEKEGCLFWKILIQLQEMSGKTKDLTVYPEGNPLRK
jgi:hypothetical protein